MIFIKKYQEKINKKNKLRLTNNDFSLITSNCTGGIVYHWLGLRFNSPFINLFMSNEDYLNALENFEKFISTPLVEFESDNNYPIGIGFNGVMIHFMHYASFDEANDKWEKRKKRINYDNLCVWLTNWNGEYKIIERFQNLPFKNKICFVNKKYNNCSNIVYLNCNKKKGGDGIGQIYRTKNIFGKRYLDDWDYVKFFNHMK